MSEQPSISINAPLTRLTPYDSHHFFGYYDLQPWDAPGRRHLAHSVPFIDRLQRPEDEARVGYFDPSASDGSAFVDLAGTNAWNFQQGAMLQWNPAQPDREIIFNVMKDPSTAGARILDVESGSARDVDLPVATVSPAGRWALSVDFGRMFSFRPGYGYAGVVDRNADNPHPKDDGIWLVDLEANASTLLFSLDQLWEETQTNDNRAAEPKLLVNHITFSPKGTRFVFLLRYRNESGGDWQTALLCASRDGSELRTLLPWSYASHYFWRDETTLLIHAAGPVGKQLYEVDVESGEFTAVNEELFALDGHCSYNPTRTHVLYDGYPHQEATPFRRLFLYDLERRDKLSIGRFYSIPEITGDIRCDLHPRFNRDGSRITIDSIHEGFRGIYSIDL